MNTEKKLTAVEWLQKEIIKFHNWKLNPIYDENCFDEIELEKSIIKAKELEKQQIIDAYSDGRLSVITKEIISYEKYYEETYKKD